MLKYFFYRWKYTYIFIVDFDSFDDMYKMYIWADNNENVYNVFINIGYFI